MVRRCSISPDPRRRLQVRSRRSRRDSRCDDKRLRNSSIWPARAAQWPDATEPADESPRGCTASACAGGGRLASSLRRHAECAGIRTPARMNSPMMSPGGPFRVCRTGRPAIHDDGRWWCVRRDDDGQQWSTNNPMMANGPPSNPMMMANGPPSNPMMGGAPLAAATDDDGTAAATTTAANDAESTNGTDDESWQFQHSVDAVWRWCASVRRRTAACCRSTRDATQPHALEVGRISREAESRRNHGRAGRARPDGRRCDGAVGAHATTTTTLAEVGGFGPPTGFGGGGGPGAGGTFNGAPGAANRAANDATRQHCVAAGRRRDDGRANGRWQTASHQCHSAAATTTTAAAVAMMTQSPVRQAPMRPQAMSSGAPPPMAMGGGAPPWAEVHRLH
jgi:hypothetical protein